MDHFVILPSRPGLKLSKTDPADEGAFLLVLLGILPGLKLQEVRDVPGVLVILDKLFWFTLSGQKDVES